MKENNTGFLMLLGVVFVGMIITIVGLSSNLGESSIKQSAGEANKIVVSGQSLLEVEPDQALIYLRIETEGKTAKDAKDQNAEISNAVVAAIKELGIKTSDIDTSSYNLHEKWEWNEITRKSEEIGYELYHVLKITINDLDQIGDVIDTGIDAGANGIQSVSYTLQKETQKEVNAEALERASTRAKEKAESIAESLDLSLGEIVKITESNNNYVPYQYSNVMESSAGFVNSKTAISPEEVSVTASISIEFAIN